MAMLTQTVFNFARSFLAIDKCFHRQLPSLTLRKDICCYQSTDFVLCYWLEISMSGISSKYKNAKSALTYLSGKMTTEMADRHFLTARFAWFCARVNSFFCSLVNFKIWLD